MSSAIDQAAAAFQQDIGGSAPQPKSDVQESRSKPEPIFDNFNVDEGGEGGVGEEDLELESEGLNQDQSFDEGEEPEEEEGNEEGNEEEEEEDEDEEGDEADSFLTQEVEVMVDGEPAKVTVKEALEGYIRTETFHTRLNKLAEARNVLQAEAVKIVEDRNRYAERLSEAEKLLTEIVPEEPDWDTLFKEDPARARNLQKQYEGLRGRIEQIRADRAKAEAEAAEAEGHNLRVYVEEEKSKLFNTIKEWSDPKIMAKDLDSMRRTASAAGFTPEEYGQIYDHRMFVVLRKAAKYDRMMANKPKPVSKGGKPVSPGAGSRSTAPKGVARAQDRLRKTGRVEDAASVFKQFL